jgi:hypothetical protein
VTYDEKVHEAMRLCANGNTDAWGYLSIIARSARLIDDLVDEPKKWVRENSYNLAQLLLVDLPNNAFFDANKSALLPLHVTSLNAWIDSNEWMEKDTTRRNYALVIRDQLTELALLVAYITGGNGYMRKTSLTVRELLLKEEF